MTAIYTVPQFLNNPDVTLAYNYERLVAAPGCWFCDEVQGSRRWQGGSGRENRIITATIRMIWGPCLLQVILVSTVLYNTPGLTMLSNTLAKSSPIILNCSQYYSDSATARWPQSEHLPPELSTVRGLSESLWPYVFWVSLNFQGTMFE